MSDTAARFEQLRSERDRFVAFAFAAADVVLELDAHCGVRYAAGATQALFAADSSELVGKGLFDLVAPQDRDRLRVAMIAVPAADRLSPITVQLCGESPAQVVMTGYHLADLEGRYFLAVGYDRQSLPPGSPAQTKRDEATGLLDQNSFGSVMSGRIEQVKARGGHCDLTLFDFKDLDSLRERVDEASMLDLIGHLGGMLRANSVDGDSAGYFRNNTYGVLHAASLDVDGLSADIETYARGVDPAGSGFGVRTSTVGVDAAAAAIGPEDTAKAVIYMANTFSDAQGDDFAITTLSQGGEMMVNDTIARIATFKDIVREGRFKVALQPIVELATGEVHHYEALARFDELGSGSPFALITFAEEVGVISAFDLAMARRTIELLAAIEANGEVLHVAVNLSRRSLGSAQFIEALISLLDGYGPIRDRLLFEVTESANVSDLTVTNQAIQRLRAEGHTVCLDDFGAGSSAFQSLRTLKVDVVKIDGMYVREALTAPNGKAFFQATTDLCRSLGIDVVAEMVEDWETVKFLRECGVRYGQGYLFGKPVIATGTFRGDPGVRIEAPTTPQLARRHRLPEQA